MIGCLFLPIPFSGPVRLSEYAVEFGDLLKDLIGGTLAFYTVVFVFTAPAWGVGLLVFAWVRGRPGRAIIR